MLPDSNELDALREDAHQAAREDRDVAAAELFACYLRRRPEDGFSWFLYGDILRVLGLRPEAERALQKAIELNPEKSQPYAALARLHDSYGDRQAAEHYFSEACNIYKDGIPGWLWILRGGNLAVAGRLSEAEHAHRTAIACENVDLGEAWLNLGYVLRAQGRYTESADAFRRAQTHDPVCSEIAEAIQSQEGLEVALQRIRDIGPPG